VARRKNTSSELGTFLHEYGRRAQKGQDPNDRIYDRDIEKQLRHIEPEDLDRMMHGEGDNRLPAKISK
jgi:hypothetical protein